MNVFVFLSVAKIWKFTFYALSSPHFRHLLPMSAANSSSLGIDIFLFGTSLAFENIRSTLQLTSFS